MVSNHLPILDAMLLNFRARIGTDFCAKLIRSSQHHLLHKSIAVVPPRSLEALKLYFILLP